MTTTPTTPPPTQRAIPEGHAWSGSRTALVVVGGVIGLLGAGALVGGGLVFWADQQRDADGFMNAGPEVFATDSYAMAVPSLDLSMMGPDDLYEGDVLGDLRIRAESVDDGSPLFIGVGPANDVAAYLESVAHDEISDIGVDPFDATYTPQPGGEPTSEPAAQTFWAASDAGPGQRSVNWDISSGDWAVVVMNADGSAGVQADVEAGATMPVIQVIAIVVLVVGGALLIGGATMIVTTIATRGPRRPDVTA